MSFMSDPSYSDEELVRLSKEDKRYFATLVDRYEKPLRRYVGKLGKFNKEDLDDLLQDVFIKLYKNINAFDSSLKFSSWIYRIAHNETISFFRHNHVRPQGHVLDIPEEILENLLADTQLTEDIEQKETYASLNNAIELLPQNYKDVILLKYFEYKSYEEISDILRLPPGTVATRLNRAKEKLHIIMKKHGYDVTS